MLVALDAGAASALQDAAREGRIQDAAAQRAVAALADHLRLQGARPEDIVLRLKELLPIAGHPDSSPVVRLRENAIRWGVQAYFAEAPEPESRALRGDKPDDETPLATDASQCRGAEPARLCDESDIHRTSAGEALISLAEDAALFDNTVRHKSPSIGSSAIRLERVDGVVWRVREVDVSRCSNRGEPHALLFESAQAIRRVRDYPANWCDLPAEELFALSWRR